MIARLNFYYKECDIGSSKLLWAKEKLAKFFKNVVIFLPPPPAPKKSDKLVAQKHATAKILKKGRN